MALRLAMLNSSKGSKGYGSFSISRLTHSIAMPSPTDVLLSPTTKSPQCVLPESDQISSSESNGAGLGFPCSPFSGGSMELMAVPRKKVFFFSLFLPYTRHTKFYLHFKILKWRVICMFTNIG